MRVLSLALVLALPASATTAFAMTAFAMTALAMTEPAMGAVPECPAGYHWVTDRCRMILPTIRHRSEAPCGDYGAESTDCSNPP